ncbi:MAG: hypothetical protein K0R87_1824 [Pseudonocardia sp.]|nr:hypothetical protein [Pseudonocardia sp.]
MTDQNQTDQNHSDREQAVDETREEERPTEIVSTGIGPPARRRGPDPLTLIVGLATLAMAVFAFTGELPGGIGLDPRWLLAGGAAVIGLALLVGSIRGRSGRRPGG